MNWLLSASRSSFLHPARKVSNWQAKSSGIEEVVAVYHSKESLDLADYNRLVVKQDWDHVDKRCIRVHLVVASVRVAMVFVTY
jgi:hypothetical protein